MLVNVYSWVKVYSKESVAMIQRGVYWIIFILSSILFLLFFFTFHNIFIQLIRSHIPIILFSCRNFEMNTQQPYSIKTYVITIDYESIRKIRKMRQHVLHIKWQFPLINFNGIVFWPNICWVYNCKFFFINAHELFVSIFLFHFSDQKNERRFMNESLNEC